MGELYLALTPEEKEFLSGLLRSVLGETRVEVRHTRTADYRQRVKDEEQLIRRLMAKLSPQSETAVCGQSGILLLVWGNPAESLPPNERASNLARWLG